MSEVSEQAFSVDASELQLIDQNDFRPILSTVYPAPIVVSVDDSAQEWVDILFKRQEVDKPCGGIYLRVLPRGNSSIEQSRPNWSAFDEVSSDDVLLPRSLGTQFWETPTVLCMLVAYEPDMLDVAAQFQQIVDSIPHHVKLTICVCVSPSTLNSANSAVKDAISALKKEVSARIQRTVAFQIVDIEHPTSPQVQDAVSSGKLLQILSEQAQYVLEKRAKKFRQRIASLQPLENAERTRLIAATSIRGALVSSAANDMRAAADFLSSALSSLGWLLWKDSSPERMIEAGLVLTALTSERMRSLVVSGSQEKLQEQIASVALEAIGQLRFNLTRVVRHPQRNTLHGSQVLSPRTPRGEREVRGDPVTLLPLARCIQTHCGAYISMCAAQCIHAVNTGLTASFNSSPYELRHYLSNDCTYPPLSPDTGFIRPVTAPRCGVFGDVGLCAVSGSDYVNSMLYGRSALSFWIQRAAGLTRRLVLTQHTHTGVSASSAAPSVFPGAGLGQYSQQKGGTPSLSALSQQYGCLAAIPEDFAVRVTAESIASLAGKDSASVVRLPAVLYSAQITQRTDPQSALDCLGSTLKTVRERGITGALAPTLRALLSCAEQCDNSGISVLQQHVPGLFSCLSLVSVLGPCFSSVYSRTQEGHWQYASFQQQIRKLKSYSSLCPRCLTLLERLSSLTSHPTLKLPPDSPLFQLRTAIEPEEPSPERSFSFTLTLSALLSEGFSLPYSEAVATLIGVDDSGAEVLQMRCHSESGLIQSGSPLSLSTTVESIGSAVSISVRSLLITMAGWRIDLMDVLRDQERQWRITNSLAPRSDCGATSEVACAAEVLSSNTLSVVAPIAPAPRSRVELDLQGVVGSGLFVVGSEAGGVLDRPCNTTIGIQSAVNLADFRVIADDTLRLGAFTPLFIIITPHIRALPEISLSLAARFSANGTSHPRKRCAIVVPGADCRQVEDKQLMEACVYKFTVPSVALGSICRIPLYAVVVLDQYAPFCSEQPPQIEPFDLLISLSSGTKELVVKNIHCLEPMHFKFAFNCAWSQQGGQMKSGLSESTPQLCSVSISAAKDPLCINSVSVIHVDEPDTSPTETVLQEEPVDIEGGEHLQLYYTHLPKDTSHGSLSIGWTSLETGDTTNRALFQAMKCAYPQPYPAPLRLTIPLPISPVPTSPLEVKLNAPPSIHIGSVIMLQAEVQWRWPLVDALTVSVVQRDDSKGRVRVAGQLVHTAVVLPNEPIRINLGILGVRTGLAALPDISVTQVGDVVGTPIVSSVSTGFIMVVSDVFSTTKQISSFPH